MLKSTISIASLIAVSITIGTIPAGQSQDVPPGHPQVTNPEKPKEVEDVAANQEDVATVEAAINAYYDSISGPRGEARDWARFKSLFMDVAQMITIRVTKDIPSRTIVTPERFAVTNDRYFTGGGYFEKSINLHIDGFGNMAQVFSTYESRRNEADEKPYSRGINSFQLLYDGKRWWIVSVIWDYERPRENLIPEEYSGD